MWNLKCLPPVIKQYFQWRDGDTNTARKPLTHNFPHEYKGTESEVMDKQWLARLESHAIRDIPPKTQNILLHLETWGLYSSDLNGFTRLLMKIDAEIHRQTLGRIPGIFEIWRGEIERSREVKNTTRKPIESKNLGP